MKEGDIRKKYIHTQNFFKGAKNMKNKRIICAFTALMMGISALAADIHEVYSLSDGLNYCGVNDFADLTECRGEGKVIVVLDTKLETPHDMFTAIDDKNVRYSKNDIEKIISDPDFHGSSDIDSVYINSKVPYNFYYQGEETNLYENDDHGTHVSGIAAGNKVEYENTIISGTAPDAQLIFMSINMYSDEAVLQAFEDAIKFDADVINCSFGSLEEVLDKDDYLPVFKEAEEKGIIICQASGNDGLYYASVERPEFSTISNYADLPCFFSVANYYDEIALKKGCFDDDYYNETYDCPRSSINGICKETDIIDSLGEGEFDAVWASLDNFSNTDMKDKIVFVSAELNDLSYLAGDYENISDDDDDDSDEGIKLKDTEMNDDIDNESLNKICRKASENGAVGLVVFSTKYHDYCLYDDSVLPCAVIHSGGVLSSVIYEGKVTLKYIKDLSCINPTSSCGIPSSMILTPDISAPGTDVLSSVFDNSYSVYTGTSMASPFAAGCCAALLEYLDKQHTQMSKAQKAVYIKNLMMNSAVPDIVNGVCTTPRKQGAGVISLNNLMKDKVIMTGPEGDAKISLGDLLEDDFEIDLTLSNISNEDVVFKNAELLVITDEANEQNEITGSRNISFTADLSGLKSIKAGETRKEKIKVSLDKNESEEILKTFVNGFYTEGFIVLSGAENCCDISIPFNGFHGDAVKDSITIKKEYGVLPYVSTLAEYKAALENGKTPEDLMQEIEKKKNESEDMYLSYNRDKIYDLLPQTINAAAPCLIIKDIKDLTYNAFNCHAELDETDLAPDRKHSIDSEDEYTLPDGNYRIDYKVYTGFKRQSDIPSSFSLNLYVDRKAPDTVFTETEKEGRKYLSIDSKDKNLDGFIIVGIYKPNAKKSNNKMTDIIKECVQLSDLLIGHPDNEMSSLASSPVVTQLHRLLKNDKKNFDPDDFDLIDIIKSEADSMSLEYDVTDFSFYSIAAADKCGNMSVYEKTSELENKIRSGLWDFTDNSEYYLKINEDLRSGELISTYDHSSYDVIIKTENDQFVLYDPYDQEENTSTENSMEKIGTIQLLSDDHLVITNDSEISICKLLSENCDQFFFDENDIKDYINLLILDKFKDYSIYAWTIRIPDDPYKYNITISGKKGASILEFDVNKVTGKGIYKMDDATGEFDFLDYKNNHLTGDTDFNGSVDSNDIINMKNKLLEYNKANTQRSFFPGIGKKASLVLYDINGDGNINVLDLVHLKKILLNN